MAQYIEPDTEPNIPNQIPQDNINAPNASRSSNTTNQTSSFDFFSLFVTPKVDLSNTFTQFTGGPNGNNKVRERQYSGGDTLDEPIWETLKRDLIQIGRRVAIVVWPMQLSLLAAKQQQRLVTFAESNGVLLPELILSRRRSIGEDPVEAEGVEDTAAALVKNGLEWDLWGPLVFSLVYSLSLGFSSPNSQMNQVFLGTFAFVWLFSLVAGLNIQLLGGNISFMSAISACGYLLFPIVIGSILSAFVFKWKILRLVIMFVLWSWSVYSGVLSLKCSGVLPGRVFLAVYPVGLMYAVLGWICVIT